ncbi:MAG: hypothetical protein KBC56_03405 [Flavobacterium sp.]|nr:hypothetical protein [Flavobacterium sp.]
MENDKTIEEIFEDVKDSKKLNFLIEKLSTPIKKDGTILHYPTLYFKKYLECKAQYESDNEKFNELKKQVELGDAKTISEMSISGSLYRKKVQFSLQFWISNGFKNEIEKIILQSNQLQ